MPLVYSPFFIEYRRNPEVLTAGHAPPPRAADRTGAGKDGAGAREVILEQGGVHYINRGVMAPDRETIKKLDQDFLHLVDSVLK
jgi:hypothetical protein